MPYPHPGITESEYDDGTKAIGFTTFQQTAAFHCGPNDDGEPGCWIGVSGDPEGGSIWLDQDQSSALCSYLHEWLADYEG